MHFIKYVGLIILWVDVLVFVSALSVSGGGGIPPQTNVTTTNDSNTVIEIKKNVTVITGSALETLTPLNANLTNTKEANRAKSRKVTQVDSFGGGGAVVADSKSELEKNSMSKTHVSSSSTTTTTTTPPPKLARVGLKVAENIYIDLAKPGTVQANNASSAPQTDKNKEGNDVKSTLLTTAKTTNITETVVANISRTLDTDDNAQLNHTDKNNITGVNDTATALNTTKTPTAAPPVTNNSSSSPSAASTDLDAKSENATTAKTNSSSFPIVSNKTNIITTTPLTTSINTTTTSTTPSTTTTSTTTTTTTTTPKPKKPTITYGVEDFPDLDKENPAWHNLTQQQQTSSSKSPMPEAPYAQPSQEEFNNNNFHGSRDYILPIVSMIFIIPLVIGVLITTYRRFRDCWSTRHYRRMDFLVDGMYND